MAYETVIDSAVTDQPVIAAERFDLRPLRALGCRADRDERGRRAGGAGHAEHPAPLSARAAEALIARAQADDRAEDIWAIDGTRAGGPEVMGLDVAQPCRCRPVRDRLLGRPAWWNTGIASAAVEAMLAANPHARARSLPACSRTTRLGAGLDELRLSVSGGCRKLLRRARGQRAHMDLQPQDGLRAAAAGGERMGDEVPRPREGVYPLRFGRRGLRELSPREIYRVRRPRWRRWRQWRLGARRGGRRAQHADRFSLPAAFLRR